MTTHDYSRLFTTTHDYSRLTAASALTLYATRIAITDARGSRSCKYICYLLRTAKATVLLQMSVFRLLPTCLPALCIASYRSNNQSPQHRLNMHMQARNAKMQHDLVSSSLQYTRQIQRRAGIQFTFFRLVSCECPFHRIVGMKRTVCFQYPGSSITRIKILVIRRADLHVKVLSRQGMPSTVSKCRQDMPKASSPSLC